jgi:tetratricopeptide (TPR) repeat protein
MRAGFAYLTVLAVVAMSPIARGDVATESFAKGEALLAKGDFTAALTSYAAAARADRSNREYLQHYVVLRQIVDLRGRLDGETDPQRWQYTARALRAFYAKEQIYPELLKIDQEIHARRKSADSAALLAETQLAMDQNEAAVATLSALQTVQASPTTQSLLGIALVRSGKMGRAKQIAQELAVPADAGPSATYAAARLHAATGDSAKAFALLRTCFEATLPSQLEGFKSHARECPEFAKVAADPGFAAALETRSKVSESKCSGGSSCAGCPMSGKCPRSQGKP